MKKLILGTVLLSISTFAFAGQYTVMCKNPFSKTSIDEYKSTEISNVVMSSNGTKISLNNGKVIRYSPAIQCIMIEE